MHSLPFPVPRGTVVTEAQVEQLSRCDWRLHVVFGALAWQARLRGLNLRVTSIERTPEQTADIYRSVGAPPPASSVHDVRPCRGLDAVPVPIGELPGDQVQQAAREAAEAVNRIAIYPRGFRAVLWHAVAGMHFHCQVPYDGLDLRG